MPNAANTGPGYPEGYQSASGDLATIINNSVATGFFKWGFVILRGVYDNDDEWQTFLNLFKAAIADELHDSKLEDQLGPHLEWTVIEDRTALESASKATVRTRFLAWVEEQKRDGEIADRPWAAGYLPRYKFCLYVDEVCIKSIVARLHGGKLIGFQWCLSSTGSVVIVNGLHQDYTPEEKDDADDDEEEDDDEGYMEVDGTTHYDVGWAYIGVLGYAELYSNLGSGGSHGQIWDGMVYRGRRPERDPEPDYDYGRPLSEVERGAKYGQRIKK
ncbi:hypothetical protein CH63R_12277 [Colletotrichum higginsianum IMI 349063]|uniref:Uncharacterized protein n=2 Tax=Colletotrichum destructivum species complex TaxID=2707350 RepID=A0A1B7Y0P0_COLHI|nr:hypothetical protein CH63R_12277 [Colletotrichum higginsianum IMI 349063]KAJ0166583.1 hypothetical protein CTA2_6688 [Colletotrichum tanaceti]OBR05574.1 hypothetical protein CH63R_12277 [Colletotrichum higginsianum IMI 349063]TKW57148.1 hypothetical protein CTA1_9045 [Colletotrichum tanaceti]